METPPQQEGRHQQGKARTSPGPLLGPGFPAKFFEKPWKDMTRPWANVGPPGPGLRERRGQKPLHLVPPEPSGDSREPSGDGAPKKPAPKGVNRCYTPAFGDPTHRMTPVWPRWPLGLPDIHEVTPEDLDEGMARLAEKGNDAYDSQDPGPVPPAPTKESPPGETPWGKTPR